METMTGANGDALRQRLEEVLADIGRTGQLREDGMEAARRRQHSLAKPTGALGRLEDISIQLAGITGQVKNRMERRAIVVFCADNGVVAQGVASAPQSVTRAQTINFTRGLTGVSSMAAHFGIDLLVVDVGVKLPIPDSLLTMDMTAHVCDETGCGLALTRSIVNRRIAPGTRDLSQGPAMRREEALAAILTGVEAAEAIKRCGYDVLGVGEMGIGNTTSSACVLSALLDCPAEKVVGRGGGLSDAGLATKRAVVSAAVRRCRQRGLGPCRFDSDAAGTDQVLDILAEVGGFDICAMAGAFLGAARYRLPVVIDGYISAVAALAAVCLAPHVRGYLFGSHTSREPGFRMAMEALGVPAYLDLGMRLGEGSGCPLAFYVLDAACATMNGMATYEEGAIDADYLQEAEKGTFF